MAVKRLFKALSLAAILGASALPLQSAHAFWGPFSWGPGWGGYPYATPWYTGYGHPYYGYPGWGYPYYGYPGWGAYPYGVRPY